MVRRLLAFALCTALLGAPPYLDPGQVRLDRLLPDPPAPGSLADRADLETVLQVQAWRSPEQEALARKVEKEGPYAFSEVLGEGFTPEALPRTAALIRQVLGEARGITLQLKGRYTRPRPPKADPRVKPCVSLEPTASYPSGHSTRAFLTAGLLAELFPERKEELEDFARRSAWARVQGGVHYPTDVQGGRLLAEALLNAMRKNPAFQEEAAACRKEAAVLLLKKAG